MNQEPHKPVWLTPNDVTIQWDYVTSDTFIIDLEEVR